MRARAAAQIQHAMNGARGVPRKESLEDVDLGLIVLVAVQHIVRRRIARPERHSTHDPAPVMAASSGSTNHRSYVAEAAPRPHFVRHLELLDTRVQRAPRNESSCCESRARNGVAASVWVVANLRQFDVAPWHVAQGATSNWRRLATTQTDAATP